MGITLGYHSMDDVKAAAKSFKHLTMVKVFKPGTPRVQCEAWIMRQKVGSRFLVCGMYNDVELIVRTRGGWTERSVSIPTREIDCTINA